MDNEIKDETIKCESCVHRETKFVCQACRIYSKNPKFVDLYMDENNLENIKLTNNTFFAIRELKDKVVLALKSPEGKDNVVVPLTFQQAYFLQKQLFRISRKRFETMTS
jgi:hypothetical protein